VCDKNWTYRVSATATVHRRSAIAPARWLL
jgi:hypothetical protein